MGVMVLSDTQLIPISQNGVQDENFVENAGKNTFDNDDDNDIIKINNRNSYIGRPTAIYTLGVNLNMRQQKILDALPQYDSHLIIRKESISMSDKILVLSKRPAIIKSIHDITFNISNRTPLNCRESPIFSKYFDSIWRELNTNE